MDEEHIEIPAEYHQHPMEYVTVATLKMEMAKFELRVLNVVKPKWAQHFWQAAGVLLIIAGALYAGIVGPIDKSTAAAIARLDAHDAMITELRIEQTKVMSGLDILIKRPSK